MPTWTLITVTQALVARYGELCCQGCGRRLEVGELVWRAGLGPPHHQEVEPKNALLCQGCHRRMEKITATDAENVAREFIGTRHPAVKRILFRRTWREGDVWLVEGELWFKRAHFFTVRRSFRLRISGETGEVASYEETKKAKLGLIRAWLLMVIGYHLLLFGCVFAVILYKSSSPSPVIPIVMILVGVPCVCVGGYYVNA